MYGTVLAAITPSEISGAVTDGLGSAVDTAQTVGLAAIPVALGALGLFWGAPKAIGFFKRLIGR